jgi:hypothetical protein
MRMNGTQVRAGPAVADKDAKASVEKRRVKRQQVLKRGQLIFGFAGSTIDCLIIDETSYGMLIENPLMTDLPERLRVSVAGGATFDAVRRWSMGNKIGLEFIQPERRDNAVIRKRLAIKLALKNQNVHSAVLMLRDVNFFEDEELRVIAEAAEASVAWLISMLD